MEKAFLLSALLIGLVLGWTWALDSSKYEEPGCVNAPPAPDLSEGFISKIAAWHVPIASTYFYHNIVEKFTNKSATQEQLGKLCLKMLFMASSQPNTPYLVAIGGLNKVLTYQCTSSSIQTQNCDGIPGTPSYLPGVEAEETIVRTDNKNYILMVQCIRKKNKAWYLLTPSDSEPTDTVKKEALSAAVNLGFDRKYGSMISYSSCPKPKKV